MNKRLVFAALTTLSFSAVPAIPCDGKAVVKTNPSTGNDERLCSVWDGHDYEIEWSEKTTGWSAPIRLTDNLSDDVAPDVAFAADGTTGVVWREGGGGGSVHYRERALVDGIWTWRSGSALVSDGTSDASAPRIRFDGAGAAWIGWHEYNPDGSVSVMSGVGDSPTPWPMAFENSPVGITEASGDLQLDMNAEAGEQWIVWVESSDDLAYAEWNDVSGGWGPVLLEPYSGPGDVDEGKERVREEVLP